MAESARPMAWASAFAIPLLAWTLAAHAQAGTADPVRVAHDAYEDQCAACHGSGLGGGFGPPLNGPEFVARWGASPEALRDFIQAKMPPANPGSLAPATAAAITSHLRRLNHLPADVHPANVDAGQAPHAPPPLAVADDDYSRAHKQRLLALAAATRPVTDAMLSAPPDEDWLSWRRTPDAHGFSPLGQIDAGNVHGLALAWSLTLDTGTNAIAPLVHDGVMYLNNNGTIKALDARTGDPIWHYARPATTTRVPLSQPRGIALYGDAVYAPTIDNHILALDAHSGALLWDHAVAAPADRLEMTAAPIAVRGKIVAGMSGCQGGAYKGGCFIVALDAATGREAWRFHSIARPGQPGGDSWNGAPLDERFGGSIWTAGSYDPDLNLLYFGTAQTYIVSTLLTPNGRPGASRDALYSDSTLALDPDSGRLVWHYQHFPGDVWDLDWAFEQTILTLPTPAGPRKAIVTLGKLGIIDAVDAQTGRYLWSKDLGLQNLVTAIDPKTGRKSIDPMLIPERGRTKTICPSAVGGRNWPATAYDAATGMLYVPLLEACMTIALQQADGGELRMAAVKRPASDGLFGRVMAVNLRDRTIGWTNRQRAQEASAMLATAGGIVFEGSRDRWFRALDAADGSTLWEARLDNTPNAFPISFAVDGRQYVAIVTGGGSPLDNHTRSFTPELGTSPPNKTLWVFALPKPPARKAR